MLQGFTGGGRILLTHRRRCDPVVPIFGIGLQYDHLAQVPAETLLQRITLTVREALATGGSQIGAIAGYRLESFASFIRFGARGVFIDEVAQRLHGYVRLRGLPGVIAVARCNIFEIYVFGLRFCVAGRQQ